MDSEVAVFPTFRKTWENARIIPTGLPELDNALVSGGIPSGSIVELSGPLSSGKSTICQRMIAESQQQGGWCAMIDADQAWEPGLARRCGVDLSHLLVCNMYDLSSALDALCILAKSGAMSLIVLDSISPLHPLSDHAVQQVQGSESLDDLVSRSLRQISRAVTFFQTAVVITRLTLPRAHPVYHELASNTSRLALEMHASIRIRLSPISMAKDFSKPAGHKVRAFIIKNTFHPCQQFVDLDIM